VIASSTRYNIQDLDHKIVFFGQYCDFLGGKSGFRIPGMPSHGSRAYQHLIAYRLLLGLIKSYLGILNINVIIGSGVCPVET